MKMMSPSFFHCFPLRSLILLPLCCCVVEAAPYKGRVYVDANGNGACDQGEKTLSGVMVSDGLNVVKTGADGSFILPGHERERFIFITTPSGFKTNNAHYRRIAPETVSYDFGLAPGKGIGRDGSHRFIHVTDTEIFNTTNHEDWISDLREYAAGEGAAFIIHTGDICYEKGLKEHIGLMNTNNMDCPVFYGIGNHDLVAGKYGEQVFEDVYGPVYYSFDAGNVHYIMTPMLSGDRKPGYTKADVYRWMVNDLAGVPKDTPIVVFNHDLLTTGKQFDYGISNREKIDLNARNLKAWIYGHMHFNFMKKHGDDVVSICTGTLDKGGINHAPNTFRVINMDAKGNLDSELRYTYLDRHLHIAVPSGDRHPSYSNGNVPLVVNTYHSSSPTRSVSYSCSVDGKPVVNDIPLKQLTDWSWAASIPLKAIHVGKKARVVVTTTFNDGKTAQKESEFVYRPARKNVELKADWVNLLGNPEHDGVSSARLTPPLELVWTSNAGGNIFMTSPIIAGGSVYVATIDDNLKGKARIVALDGASGAVKWACPVRNSIQNTIVAGEGAVFAQDVEGYLYAVDIRTGKLRWEKQLPIKPTQPLIEGLVIADGIVYAGAGKGLCAIDAGDGRVIWQNKAWNQNEGSTATHSLGDGILAASSQWGGLHGHDAAKGTHAWFNDRNGLRSRSSSPVIRDRKLYTLSGKSLFELSADKGEVIRSRELPFNVEVASTPLVTEKEIIFGTADAGLVALDKESLETKWQFKTGDALMFTSPYTRTPSATIETSPVLAGDIVYVAASDGIVYAVSRETGKEVWKYAMGAPSLSSVAVSGNTLITCDFGGNVYAFRAQEGE